MKKTVELRNVTLDIPTLSVSSRSLRKSLMNLSSGGRLMRDGRQRVHVRALEAVSLDLFEGDRLGIVGHNGSGKSSLLRAMGGIYAPAHGSVQVFGEISAVLDPATGVDPEASGRENVGLLARLRGRGRAEAEHVVEEVAEFTGLGDFFDMPVKTYSPGMLARLAFAVGTCWRPDILLMDEWIAVADERFKAQAMRRLSDYVSSARTVVLATHDAAIVRELCTKVLVLERGCVAWFGPAEEAAVPAAA